MNVHDFAFTADPTYRIDEIPAFVDGRIVNCVALVQEQHAAGWLNAAEYTKKVIETNSKYFGNYIYPKIIVADARDGMEYPMLTLDGGFDPYYRDLFIHEISHQWFFAMVGNNETYRAALDEGFTQFLTAFTYRKIDGDIRIVYPDEKKYALKHRKPENIQYTEVYYGYLTDAMRNNDATLNTHSDYFNSALGHGGGYHHVYYKTAAMLYNLQYVLGEELFLAAMRHYFEQWKLCHPYFEDFRNSITEYTHADLNWFFDEWMETAKNIDYAIKKVKPTGTTNLDGQTLYKYEITFRRIGGMQMPIDFSVLTDGGDTIKYYIPNTWFNKYENDNSGISFGRLNGNMLSKTNVLSKWTGWDMLNEEYTGEIILPSKITDVIIDPSHQLADINKLNNSWKCPVDWKFDSHIMNYPDWNSYEIKWRPDVWYNAVDFVKVGVHFNGDYMNYKHLFEFTAWYNTGSLNKSELTIADIRDVDYFSFDLNYKTATDKFLPNSNFFFDTKYLDGVFGVKIGGEKFVGRSNRNKISVFFNSAYYLKNYYLNNYLLYGEHVLEQENNAVHIQYEHNYNYFGGNGKLKLGFRSDDLMSDYDYQYVNLEEINNTRFGKFDLKTRFFGQWGSGTNIPFESSLMIAGANQETLLENKYTRAVGFFPENWTTFSETT
ncbi:MAG: M1 family peptidase, partial [Fimbriimonadaceae bacterium]|nr:M1 family peptidase [Chitinophagales bacterium]